MWLINSCHLLWTYLLKRLVGHTVKQNVKYVKYWDGAVWSPLYFRYNKLSSGASATKSVLSGAGSKTATAAKNVGSATAKKLGEIRYHIEF